MSLSLNVKAETASSRADKYSSYFYSLTPSKELVSKVSSSACAAGGCVARSTASETQALFLMATLASIEGMKQQAEISSIKKENVSLSDLSKAATASAEHLVKSSEIAGGIGGMFLTNKVAQAPLNAINSLIMNTSARPLFKEFLANSSANLVGFVGFEAGAELMNRAIQMIPSEEDRKKASKLIPTMWSAFTTNNPNQSEEEKKIIKTVFSDMYEIPVENSELREKWWSFVVRNRIQTGNFVAGVSMMATGATIGNRVGNCLPTPVTKIASPVIGAAFGVAGGVAAAYVPTAAKDEITKTFQSARMKSSTMQIGTSQINLRESLKRLEQQETFLAQLGDKKNGADWKKKNIEKQVDDELAKMNSAREDLMTALYDRTHMLNSRLYTLNNKIQLAIESQNPEAERKYRTEYNQYLDAYNKSKSDISEKLSGEISFFENLKFKNLSPETNKKIAGHLNELRETQKWTGQFLNQIQSTATWGKGSQSKTNDVGLMSEQENQRLLEKMYMWGYKQKPFVETMEFNN